MYYKITFSKKLLLLLILSHVYRVLHVKFYTYMICVIHTRARAYTHTYTHTTTTKKSELNDLNFV